MNPSPVVGSSSAGLGPASAYEGAVPVGSGGPDAGPSSEAFRALLAQQPASISLPGAGMFLALPRSGGVRAGALPQHPCLAAARRSGDDDDPVDPLRRHRAALQAPETFAPPGVFSPSPGVAPANVPLAVDRVRAAVSLEDLLPALVRRIAWSGDAERGTVRLEIGAGELAGATLLVHADAGRVRVHLRVPPGVDAAAWQARIRQRLESRRIVAEAVEVT